MPTNIEDLHVMPNDGRHRAEIECWCGPRVDDGVPPRAGRVWIHHDANHDPGDEDRSER